MRARLRTDCAFGIAAATLSQLPCLLSLPARRDRIRGILEMGSASRWHQRTCTRLGPDPTQRVGWPRVCNGLLLTPVAAQLAPSPFSGTERLRFSAARAV